MTLRFTRRARNDLRDILEYIAKDNPAAADRLRLAFLDAGKLIAMRPHLGLRNANVPELRSRLVARYPYRIHYRIEDADVWIIHIRHSARRPWNPEA
jgi:plasmid stabilization system protein ParE